MLQWFNEILIWSMKNNVYIYGIIVVVTMGIVGTAFGLIADLCLRATGINFDKYTDKHAE